MNSAHSIPIVPTDLDGSITVLDGRQCVLQCTHSNCAVVENRLPHVDAGFDQSIALGTTVQLDGSDSSDADGDSLTYM